MNEGMQRVSIRRDQNYEIPVDWVHWRTGPSAAEPYTPVDEHRGWSFRDFRERTEISRVRGKDCVKD